MAYKRLQADNNSIISALQKEISPNVRDLIPRATAENMMSRGQLILNNPELRNEMASALINKFFASIFWKTSMSNPLSMFKQGSSSRMGDRVEEYFIDLADMYDFDPAHPPKDMWKNYPADVKSTFYKTNFQVYVPMTLHERTLARAFESETGLAEYTNNVMSSMYNRDYLTEYRNMIELMCHAIATGCMRKFVIPELNASTSKDLVRLIKDLGTRFTFPSNKYNNARVTNNVDRSNQVFFVDSTVDAMLDVELYAYMFNWTKADIDQRKIVIDGFNDLFGIWGVLCDEQFFRVWDTYKEMNSTPFNARGLYWNYFLHHHMILAYSKFANAVVFCSNDRPELPRIATPAINTRIWGKPVRDMVEDVTYKFSPKKADNLQVIGQVNYLPSYPHFRHDIFKYGERPKQGWFLPIKIDDYNKDLVRIEVKAGAFDTETGFSKDESGQVIDYEVIPEIDVTGVKDNNGYIIYLGDYVDYEKYNGGKNWTGEDNKILPDGSGIIKGRPIVVDIYKTKMVYNSETGLMEKGDEELAYSVNLDVSNMMFENPRHKHKINLDEYPKASGTLTDTDFEPEAETTAEAEETE